MTSKDNRDVIINVRITPEMKRKLDEVATKEDRSVASVVRRAITDSLELVILEER